MYILNSPHFNYLQRSLDAASLRQKVTANNIANVDTPYFKRSDVQFEELLRQAMDKEQPSLVGYRTDPRHFYIGAHPVQVSPTVVTDETSFMNNNMNNVDMDMEQALLAKNQLRYNTVIQQVNHEIKMLRTAIEGR